MSGGVRGGCLCGAVGVEIAGAVLHADACHCATCRRICGGGPFFAVAAGTDPVWQGAENIRTYRSSDWAERGFCGNCGTVLFYRLVESGETHVAAGLLGEADLALGMQIFIDRKPGWYALANETPTMTEAEFVEKYMGGAE